MARARPKATGQDYTPYVFIAILLILFYFVFLIARPFLTTIILACILTYLFYPIYLWFLRKTKEREMLSSALTIFVIIIIIILPVALSLGSITQSMGGYMKKVASAIGEEADEGSLTARINQLTGINIQSEEFIRTIANRIFAYGNNFVTSFLDKIVSLFILVFLMFYLFVSGPRLMQRIYSLIPLRYSLKNIILQDFKEVTRAILFGTIVTALVQGIIAGIGYLIFGVEGALFWALLTFLFALLPYFGTALVYIPLSVFMLLEKDYVGGIGLLLYGTLIIGTIDNIIKPKLIGDRAKVHPALILIGVLGGIKVFGFVGIFLGPLLFASFSTLLKIYNEHTAEKAEKGGKKHKI